MTVGRAVLRLVSDKAGLQLVQVEALQGEVLDRVEHMQPFGFASHPLPGAEAVIVSVGGSRNHPLAVVIADRRHRPACAAGETVIHNSTTGQTITLSAAGVTVKTPGLFRVEAESVEIHATEFVKLDAGGAGVTYRPSVTEDWREGLPTVPSPPSPPEHPS